MKDYIKDIFEKFIAGSYGKELENEVHQWMIKDKHASQKEKAMKSVWDKTKSSATEDTFVSLQQVCRKIGIASSTTNESLVPSRQNSKRVYLHWIKYAAVAVILVAVSISSTYFYSESRFTQEPLVEHFTQLSKIDKIVLPDGSEVYTNSGTMLYYPREFKGDTRTVYLAGEAVFKVKTNPECPFIVRTSTVRVTALGTEFNVEAYPENENIKATLLEGTIKVDSDLGGDRFILTPGQQVSYLKKSGKGSLSNVDINHTIAWKQGIIIFRSATMQDILQALGRKYNVKFQYNETMFGNDKFSFRFKNTDSLTEVMDVIKTVIGNFEYTINNDVCSLRKD